MALRQKLHVSYWHSFRSTNIVANVISPKCWGMIAVRKKFEYSTSSLAACRASLRPPFLHSPCDTRHEPLNFPVWNDAPVQALDHALAQAAYVTFNTGLAWGSESPVDSHPANSKGFLGVFGNAWHW